MRSVVQLLPVLFGRDIIKRLKLLLNFFFLWLCCQNLLKLLFILLFILDWIFLCIRNMMNQNNAKIFGAVGECYK